VGEIYWLGFEPIRVAVKLTFFPKLVSPRGNFPLCSSLLLRGRVRQAVRSALALMYILVHTRMCVFVCTRVHFTEVGLTKLISVILLHGNTAYTCTSISEIPINVSFKVYLHISPVT
jgi:hypothetical protein